MTLGQYLIEWEEERDDVCDNERLSQITSLVDMREYYLEERGWSEDDNLIEFYISLLEDITYEVQVGNIILD